MAGRGMRAAALAVAALALGPGAAGAAQAEPQIDRVKVKSHDGTRLGGWIIRPGAAEKPLATVLISSPYLGQCVKLVSATFGPCWPAPRTPEDWAAHPEPVGKLVEWGYAVAWFSVRGTGVSGGCFESMGSNERRDQGVLVDWLADRKWGNGKVGAMGLSYMSATALEAAVERPKALKTIVVAGVLGDLYTYQHSPQGLTGRWNPLFDDARYAADVSLLPPGMPGGDPALTVERLPEHNDRVCPEVARVMTAGPAGATVAARDAGFWKERRLSDRYDRIKAAVLVAHGLLDTFGSGHKMQEDVMWSQIKAPKAMWLGQWEHSWPYEPSTPYLLREDLRDPWWSTLRAWLDHELRGGKRPSVAGDVRFEDDSGAWHTSDRWPPRESKSQVLYLSPQDRLTTGPPTETGAMSFRAAAQGDRANASPGLVCPGILDSVEPLGRVYFSEPVSERTVVAGNPTAYLDLTSDQPGGGVQVMLHSVGPDFACDPAGREPTGTRRLTIGGADLRYHHGGFDARPFQGGHVRVDLANLAVVLEPGDRLAVTLGYGSLNEYAEIGHAPRIGVRAGPRADSSQIVVPVLRGGFGGASPSVAYPPRP